MSPVNLFFAFLAGLLTTLSPCVLPMPATYVIARDGRIIYAFVAPDYTHRADPEDILKALK